MAHIAIFPDPAENGDMFLAVAGDKQSVGKTAGQALDALTPQLPPENAGTLIILQTRQPDAWFSKSQQERMSLLMDQWRAARDRGERLPAKMQEELDALAAAELQAATERAARLVSETH
jgi:hypothetical protein